jgi:hypothetical protein
MGRMVARSFLKGSPATTRRRNVLLGEYVDLSPGKVGQPSSVIQVQVGQYDVLHILGRITEPPDLLDGCLGWIPWHTIQGHKGLHMPCRTAMILDPETRVYQQQPFVHLNEETVGDAGEPRVGVDRRTVQVVNLHCMSTLWLVEQL